MSHTPERQFPNDLSRVYSRLNQLDVEEFYTGYQWWITHRRITALQEEIDTLRLQIHENAHYMQHARPPAVALATLARLQASGVDDLDLLDRMLERGEEWLDLIMQRLDYCEQLDFIHDNYTQWCEHALEGAYDWIDSMRDAAVDTSPLSEAYSDIEATEELLLRKLTSEEEEGEVSLVEPEVEVPEPTVAIEQAMEEQQGEAVQLSETAYVTGENGTPAVSFKQEGEEQAVTSPSTIEASLAHEEDAEVETLEVLTSEVAPQEDTGVEAVQEMPFPIEIDAAAAVEEPLPTEIDEQDTGGEAHSEEKEAEAAAGSEVLLPDAVNVESEVPVEEKLSGAAVEGVEESPVVDAPEESASEEHVSQGDAEPIPAHDEKPRRKRSFWEFLLGLPGH